MTIKTLIDFLATGFYVGRWAPFAPGTFGTLWGIPVFLVLSGLPPLWWMGITLLAVLVSIFICELQEHYSTEHDPKKVVIDEVVGYMVASMFLPFDPFFVISSFVLFRIFDAAKPYPIGWIDRRVKGGLGTVADDLAAGLVTNFILQVVLRWMERGGV